MDNKWYRVPLGPRVERVLGPSGRFVLKRGVEHELALYRRVATPVATGAPALLGAVRWPDGSVWLALEDLLEVHPDLRDSAQVAQVYEHLGLVHRRLRGVDGPAAPGAVGTADLRRELDLAGIHWPVSARSGGDPERTLLHGDYHRGNLVLQDGRVRVLDWEHSGVGHPVWDLLLLAPEEDGWDGAPRGARAVEALQAYHRAGPLAHLPWPDFLAMQQAARLCASLRRAAMHRRRAAAAPPGPLAAVILAAEQVEVERVRRLRTMLGV